MMFPVIYKEEYKGYQFIDLLVHCDFTSFRRKIGEEIWEQQMPNGQWEEEYILGDIVSELYMEK